MRRGKGGCRGHFERGRLGGPRFRLPKHAELRRSWGSQWWVDGKVRVGVDFGEVQVMRESFKDTEDGLRFTTQSRRMEKDEYFIPQIWKTNCRWSLSLRLTSSPIDK